MTATHAPSPRFESHPGHPALRALAILGLSAALTAGFLAQAWRAPAPSADDTALVRCAAGSASHPC